ncbi:Murein hydrolase activator NlpD [Halomonadaceae bacterium LMG 33818]|uniref:peptidoglycan DD-metalloendopeptidase family protein n=1 Tax=Cernens ardua TaxID=3402176 RepID=UPI003EDC2B25
MGNPNDIRANSFKQWLRPGLASAMVMVAALAGCASNSGDPVIQNANWNGSNGGSNANTSSSSIGSNDSTYQVRSGDTLYSIAWRQKMSYQELAQLNNIQPPYTLSVGQKLRLNQNGTSSTPSTSAGSSTTSANASGTQTHALGNDSAPVTSSNSDNWLLPSNSSNGANGTSNSNGVSAAGGAAAGAIAGAAASNGQANNTGTNSQATPASSANHSSNTATNQNQPSTAGTTTAPHQVQAAGSASSRPQADATRKYVPATTIHWQWPTNGTVIGQYGNSSDITSGIDIAGQQGQPIYAAGPGLVIYAGNGVRGYGNLIIIRHNDHYLSAYAHNASLLVKEGDVVAAGQKIATMGDTESSKVELHFEIRQDGKPVDPVNYLPKQ